MPPVPMTMTQPQQDCTLTQTASDEGEATDDEGVAMVTTAAHQGQQRVNDGNDDGNATSITATRHRRQPWWQRRQ